MTATQTTFARMAELDPDGRWEIYDGEVREKPSMSFAHNDVTTWLVVALGSQISRQRFVVRGNAGRVRQGGDSYFIPDVYVADRSTVRDPYDRALEVYDAPLLLVVEIWSPSTGTYDINAKLPRYQIRGDAEIWRLHPYDKTLERWIRTDDGRYDRSIVRSGIVRLAALPDVRVDLDALFAM
ncbi:MAG: Uma2 family endonuclease [Thermomicrobiales bacterium]|nr:Uma2 family endonuclease [Thermomicrobiales bacterium]